jgi:hypothetical protein
MLMTNCLELAKTFIAKEIITNPRFIEALDFITGQIDVLKRLPSQPAILKRLDYFDEQLEILFTTAVLDLPRNDLNKARIAKKFRDMGKRQEVYDFIDSLRAGQAELPEGRLDKILS